MIHLRLSSAPFLPFEIRRAFMQAPECSSDEQSLWREVLARVILDALGYTGQGTEREHAQVIKEARDWFVNSQDMVTVFDLAGVEHSRVRMTVLGATPVPRGTRIKGGE